MRFELETFEYLDSRLRQFGHTRLFHNHEEWLFIILYTHYLLKILELKNQMSKLKDFFRYEKLAIQNVQKKFVLKIVQVLRYSK